LAFIVFIVNNRLVTYGGAFAINVYTIANNLITVFILILIGLSQGIQPILGYSFGAKQTNRMFKVLKITSCIAVIRGIIGIVSVNLISRQFATILSPENNDVVNEVVRCIRVLTIGLPLLGLQITIGAFFQSIGSAGKAFTITVTKQLVFVIPPLFIFPSFWQTEGVWYAIPFSDISGFLLAVIIMTFYLRKIKKQPC
jgi:Na+-driven multidrug efflux pump